MWQYFIFMQLTLYLSLSVDTYLHTSLSLCMCRVIADWAFYVLLVRDHTLFGRAIVAAVAGAVSAAMPKTFWSLYVICFSSYVCARGPFFISSLIKKYFSLYIYRWTVHSLEYVPPLFKHLEMRFETIPLPFYYYCCLPACLHVIAVAVAVAIVNFIVCATVSWVVPFFGWIYEHENHRWLHELDSRQLILHLSYSLCIIRISSLNRSTQAHAHTPSKNYEYNNAQIKFSRKLSVTRIWVLREGWILIRETKSRASERLTVHTYGVENAAYKDKRYKNNRLRM